MAITTKTNAGATQKAAEGGNASSDHAKRLKQFENHMITTTPKDFSNSVFALADKIYDRAKKSKGVEQDLISDEARYQEDAANLSIQMLRNAKEDFRKEVISDFEILSTNLITTDLRRLVRAAEHPLMSPYKLLNATTEVLVEESRSISRRYGDIRSALIEILDSKEQGNDFALKLKEKAGKWSTSTGNKS